MLFRSASQLGNDNNNNDNHNNDNQQQQGQQQGQEGQQQQSGGGGLMGKLNSLAGGGAEGEAKEDYLDKAYDYAQERVTVSNVFSRPWAPLTPRCATGQGSEQVRCFLSCIYVGRTPWLTSRSICSEDALEQVRSSKKAQDEMITDTHLCTCRRRTR